MFQWLFYHIYCMVCLWSGCGDTGRLDLLFPASGRSLLKRTFGFLRKFQRRHFESRRVAKALAIAVPTIAVGNWLLRYEVSNFGVNPVWAYRANWPLITFLCFVLNRASTWSDRERRKSNIVKWVVVSLIHSGVSQYLYPKLVHTGVHYMLASAILLGLGPIGFVINNLVTFRREKETNKP